jgi:hypothetical protein
MHPKLMEDNYYSALFCPCYTMDTKLVDMPFLPDRKIYQYNSVNYNTFAYRFNGYLMIYCFENVQISFILMY